MIDWDSPSWGNKVHESSTGSWLNSEAKQDDGFNA